MTATAGLATETENQGLRILPAPGKVVIDGQTDDWDLSGSIYACGDVESVRDQFAVWFSAMYDAQNLYLLAHWKDPTPLNNDQSSKGGHGFNGDCLQVRFITGADSATERVSHWTCWRDRDGISVMDIAYGRDFKGGNVHDAQTVGAQQGFLVDADGAGYTQELAIPWQLLTQDGQPVPAGGQLRLAIEPNFTAGLSGRWSIKDNFKAGIVPDRVFTFRAYNTWGPATLEKQGHVKPQPARLADSREFPVTLADGQLRVDWTGLIRQRELPGFKPITFTLPADGYVSLNIVNTAGAVVRQLLTQNFYSKGSHTVKWDGLTTPVWRTPGEPVPVGDYTWTAITTPGLEMTLRGWAASSGDTPWQSGPTTAWGGDHGVPAACATDGQKVYLGWDYAESGPALIACDLAGHVQWRIGSGLGVSMEHLAVDHDIVYSVGTADSVSARELVRVRARDGVFENWQGRDTAALAIPDLWETKTGRPDRADGLDVKDGNLYLTFSSQTIRQDDITDWQAFVTKLQEPTPLAKRIMDQVDPDTTQRLARFVAGKTKQAAAFSNGPGRPRFDTEVLRQLNTLLAATDLAPGVARLGVDGRAAANRRYLEQTFAPLITPLQTGQLAVCDANTGKVRKLIPVPFPHAVRAVSDTLVYVISGNSGVLAVNPQTGAIKSIIAGLSNAKNLTVDATGKLYVGVGAPDEQVQVFTAAGKPAGTIGRSGGRQLLGPWQPDGMFAIRALVVDTNNLLWVMEGDEWPKRVSVWDVATGKLHDEFFGATHYGASGAAINPHDPNLMVSEACEWRLDPVTGRARCLGTFDRAFHGFAVFCPGSNGRQYLAVSAERDHNRGRTYGLKIFERLGDGQYQLRATVWPDPVWPPELAKATVFWSDVNGDGLVQPAEVTTLPVALALTGYNGWSLNLNPADLTLYASCPATKTVYQFPLTGFTACGAPLWDPTHPHELAFAWNKELLSGGGGMLPAPNNRLLVTCEQSYFRCYELPAGKLRWSYPNTFSGVHGSHSAPPQVPGLMRGAFGLIGTFNAPPVGTVWAINGNCGEWYLLTEHGYFLSRLFECVRFPDKAVPGAPVTLCPPGGGGEDFGGSVVQAPDGAVYIEAGHTAAWNVALNKLATIQTVATGSLTIAVADIVQQTALHDQQLQVATGTPKLEIPKLTPTLTGNFDKDFKDAGNIAYKKQEETAVRTGIASDATTLYLGWEVRDNTPWVNSATEPSQMYLAGDTVDFQFGSDAKSDPKRTEAGIGDFRLSIGNYQGQPTAVLYRKVSVVKKPKAFTSGVIKHYEMGYVDVVHEAKITVNIRPDRHGYTVEAAIPLTALDFTPQPGVAYHGDFGVTFGDPAGARTRLRSYWANQVTGLVDDAVFELLLEPKNWGILVFR